MLRLVRSARLFGRVFPAYKSPMLCLSAGPSCMATEIPISCIPPHLLQETNTPYSAGDLGTTDRAPSSILSFSCILRILRCFGDSVKEEKNRMLGDSRFVTQS